MADAVTPISRELGCVAPQRGGDSRAQGNALGIRWQRDVEALKGRHSFGRITRFALSGLGWVCIPFPRALPWAIDGLPLWGGSQSPYLNGNAG